MRNYGVFALLILILVVAFFGAGCTTTPETKQTSIAPDIAPSATETDEEWVLWNVNDTTIDLVNGSYAMFRPNLNGVLFKHLKVEEDYFKLTFFQFSISIKGLSTILSLI